MDSLLNNRIEQINVHMKNNEWRIIKGIIAAKLNGRKELNNVIFGYREIALKNGYSDDFFREFYNVLDAFNIII